MFACISPLRKTIADLKGAWQISREREGAGRERGGGGRARGRGERGGGEREGRGEREGAGGERGLLYKLSHIRVSQQMMLSYFINISTQQIEDQRQYNDFSSLLS